MTVLTLIQGVCSALALPVPSAAVASTDTQVVRLLSLMGDAVDSLISRHDWTALIVTSTPTLTATSGVATVTLPADFKRFVGNGQVYHVARRQVVVGPVSTSEWQNLTVGISPTSVAYWRRLGTTMKIAGVTTADQVTYDYVSAYAWTTGNTTPASDSDTAKIPEKLLRLELLWRWRQAAGNDYAEAMVNAERELERAANEDRGSLRPIVLSPVRVGDPNNLPFVITP